MWSTPRVKLARGIGLFFATLALGPGYGHAVLGRSQRGWMWFAATAVALLSIPLWFWMSAIVLLLYAGSAFDAFQCAAREDGPNAGWFRLGTLAFPAALLGVALVTQTFVLSTFSVWTSAMSPTVRAGDSVFLDKLTPHFRAIGRGEVIVFRRPCGEHQADLKRVVAVAGDTVEQASAQITVSGNYGDPRQLQHVGQCRVGIVGHDIGDGFFCRLVIAGIGGRLSERHFSGIVAHVLETDVLKNFLRLGMIAHVGAD